MFVSLRFLMIVSSYTRFCKYVNIKTELVVLGLTKMSINVDVNYIYRLF